MTGLRSLWALEGHWRLSRMIRHGDGSENRLTGNAHFRRSGARLIQDEEGTLVMGNQTMKATRRYIWTAQKGRLDVFFDDMRPFHTVLLGVATHQTVHLCDPDRYEVLYDFTDWPRWSARWQVEGPKKNYVMTSTYAPL
ncbi:MAG: trigger factor [Silicimonas sp.]|nr:trigger factor [Silicimonas sp.]